jgi:hypothetical protein
METAAAMADLRVVARTSACRVAGGLVALEDAGPADALAGRGTEGPGRGSHQDRAPLWPGQVCAQGAHAIGVWAIPTVDRGQSRATAVLMGWPVARSNPRSAMRSR